MFVFNSGATLTPRVDAHHKSTQHYEANNSDYVFDDGHTVWNASLRYRADSDSWSVTAGVENLTDGLYLVGGYANNAIGYENGIYSRPRNYFVNLEFEF